MRAYQASFSSGELAPELRARVDLDQYQAGLALCRNFLIRQTGGALRRPGTRYSVTTPGITRLVPFNETVTPNMG